MKYNLSEIEIICKTMNASFTYINWGGCGVFASILSKELDKMNVKHQIWVLSTDLPKEVANLKKKRLTPYRKNNSHLSRVDLLNEDIHIDHVVIKIDGWYFDSNGKSKTPNNCGRAANPIIQLTKAETHEYAKTHVGWNDTFKRSQIPLMKKKMSKLFNVMNGTVEPSILDKMVKAILG